MKASIDTRDPRRPKQGISKGAYLEAERNNQIMHENTILLNKLSKILTRAPEPIPEPLLRKGLNENSKKAERERIDRENQALLRRLQDVRSSIDADKMLEHYELHEHLIAQHSMQFVPNPFLNNTAPRSRPGSGFYPTPPASAGSQRPSTAGAQQRRSRPGSGVPPPPSSDGLVGTSPATAADASLVMGSTDDIDRLLAEAGGGGLAPVKEAKE